MAITSGFDCTLSELLYNNETFYFVTKWQKHYNNKQLLHTLFKVTRVNGTTLQNVFQRIVGFVSTFYWTLKSFGLPPISRFIIQM